MSDALGDVALCPARVVIAGNILVGCNLPIDHLGLHTGDADARYPLEGRAWDKPKYVYGRAFGDHPQRIERLQISWGRENAAPVEVEEEAQQ